MPTAPRFLAVCAVLLHHNRYYTDKIMVIHSETSTFHDKIASMYQGHRSYAGKIMVRCRKDTYTGYFFVVTLPVLQFFRYFKAGKRRR
jgi:hypothetical protein